MGKRDLQRCQDAFIGAPGVEKMEPIASLFKKTIPNYLENLPIPNTFGGWFRLSFKEWMSLLPFGAAVGGMGYLSYRALFKQSHINPSIHKESKKHVDVLEIESLGEKNAFCRCWRSKRFPYCDGSHILFNESAGDNIGPLILEKRK